MAENKRYYWLKLMDDFFDSKRIKKLRKMAGGDTYTIIYLKMQLLSLKKGGYLEYSGLEDEFYKEIALDIDEDEINVQVTIQYLLSCGLLETSDSIEYKLPFVQDNLGSETASTRRSRKSRENAQKMLQCNSVATECNKLQQNCNVEIDIEKDIDTDIEKENIKESAFSFDGEKAWNDTFDLYPKKSCAVLARQYWLRKLSNVLEENRKEVAELIYKATKLYLEDYTERNPEDTRFRFLPKYNDWLINECDYWVSIVEKGSEVMIVDRSRNGCDWKHTD